MHGSLFARLTSIFCSMTALSAVVVLCSCGGGGSNGGGSGPPPLPDFSIVASPTSIQVAPGSSQNLTISITGTDGFTGQVNVSVSGLSPDATVSPASFTVSPGLPQQVTFAAQASASAATVSLTVQGVSGNLSHSLLIALSIQTVNSSMHAPVRSRYLRTDAFYDFKLPPSCSAPLYRLRSTPPPILCEQSFSEPD